MYIALGVSILYSRVGSQEPLIFIFFVWTDVLYLLTHHHDHVQFKKKKRTGTFHT